MTTQEIYEKLYEGIDDRKFILIKIKRGLATEDDYDLYELICDWCSKANKELQKRIR